MNNYLPGFTPMVVARFWTKVEIGHEFDCWLWKGALGGGGYGAFRFDGRQRRATHIAREFFNGQPFPKGMHACHHCDNPQCVNPAHLFVGTAADTVADMMAKGRGPHQRPAPVEPPRLDL
jgi:hypothetical protein